MFPRRSRFPSRTPAVTQALSCTALLLGLLAPAAAQEGEPACGALQNGYGPFDYRTDRPKLGIVEQFHFTAQVEALIQGQSGTIGGDLDYTLRAFPNHHRALLAVMRWGERARSPQPATLPRPVECYFDRALRFRQDDTVTRLIYAKFLTDQRRESEAARQLAQVTELAGDNPLTHYNAGLLYVELKSYDKALVQAHRALSLGHAATGLRERLHAAGHWREPPLPQAAPAQEANPGGKP